MTDEVPRRDERATLLARVEQAVGSLFTIEAEIGRGGMGVVYRARDVRLRRKVALKVLPPELAFRDDVKSRFLREAQTSAQLSHPNIVPIYAVDEIDGIVFFAMGLVVGETLATQLQRVPRPTVPAVRTLLREVADALAYAHAHQVVHRDVKPDNILVEDATGRALVSDFGIARAAEGDSRLTVTGIAVGTPAYMSPEQAMGERGVDGRSDIYSLGVVGYQMLAGDLPFKAANTPAMLMKHISERPRPLRELRSDLPANLVHAIERAMAKGPAERWPDAGAFRDALAKDAVAGPELRDEPAPSAPRRAAASDNEAMMGALGRFPPFPAGPGAKRDGDARAYGPTDLAEWRAQARLWRKQVKQQVNQHVQEQVAEARGMSRRDWRNDRIMDRIDRGLRERTPEERIRRVQRAMFGAAGLITFLAVVNAVTSPHFPWVIFPAAGIGLSVLGRLAALWVDGVPFRRIFQRQEAVPAGARETAAPLRAAPREVTSRPALAAGDLAGIPRDVLDGPRGAVIREAAEAKAVIVDILESFPRPIDSSFRRSSRPSTCSSSACARSRRRCISSIAMRRPTRSCASSKGSPRAARFRPTLRSVIAVCSSSSASSRRSPISWRGARPSCSSSRAHRSCSRR